MFLSLYLPLASLVIFILWMLRLAWRAEASLRRLRQEIDGIRRALNDLKVRIVPEDRERWLNETFAYVQRTSLSGRNPLLDLINRIYAMRELARPDLTGVLSSISERELDKLEPARETPGNLLLLGIMGTVVGMVIALSTFGAGGLQGDRDSIDIGRILSSMFLAFLSTGLALLFSVFVRNRYEQVSIEQSDMLADIEGYAYTHLAPYLLPKHDHVLQQRFYEMVNTQQSMLSHSLEKSSAMVGDVLAAVTEAQGVTQSLGDSLVQSVSLLASERQNLAALQKASGTMTGKLPEQLSLTLGELSKQRGELKQFYHDMRKAVEEEKRATFQQSEMFRQRYASTLEFQKDNNMELIHRLATITDKLGAQAERQTAVVESLRHDLNILSERLIVAQEVQQESFENNIQSFLQKQFAELTRIFSRQRRA